MQIRKATTTDYNCIHTVWEKSVRATHLFLTEKDISELSQLMLAEYLPAVDLFVAEDKPGQIAAFLGASNEKVEMLFIDPSSFRKGFGKHLVQFAITTLGLKKVDVNEQNPNALNFYKAMGFKVVARSPLDGQGKAFPILHMEI